MFYARSLFNLCYSRTRDFKIIQTFNKARGEKISIEAFTN